MIVHIVMIRMVHFFSGYEGLGGVHSLLKRHEKMDRSLGLDSRFIIGWERQIRQQKEPRVFFLGINGRANIKLFRHRFAAAIQLTKPDLIVYHTPANMDFLADLDGAARRVVVLHTHPRELRNSMRFCLDLMDGVLSVSEPLQQEFLKTHPEWPSERASYLPLPVEPMAAPLPLSPLQSGDLLTIGYSGRLVKLMKRADRLVDFARELQRIKRPFRLQIAGNGELQGSIKRRLKPIPNVEFLGRLEGSAYWNVLAGWDAMLNCSDQEAGTTAILEGMAVGCLPICPDIPCQGHLSARLISSQLVYPQGDMRSAAQSADWLGRLSNRAIAAMRNQAQVLARQYDPRHYGGIFSEFLHKISALPVRSTHVVPPRMRSLDDIPFLWQFRAVQWQMRWASTRTRLFNLFSRHYSKPYGIRGESVAKV